MNFIERLLGLGKVEKRDLTFTNTDGWILPSATSTPTPDTVIGIPAVYSAVNIISTNIAKLPLNVYKVAKDGSKQLDRTHSISKLMKIRVNPYQSAFDFLRIAISHYLLWGNTYIDLVYDERGNVIEMWLLDPSSTSPIYNTEKGELYYATQIPITQEFVVKREYEIIHLKHYSKSGFIGASPISVCSDMLGSQMGMNSFNKKFYENGTMTTQVIKTDEFLDAQSKTNIRTAWENANSGLTNAHRIAILDGGLDVQEIGMPVKDMQFIETQEFNLRQIASIFNIPAFMIGDNGGLKYSNMEQQALSFVRDCLSPILTMMEQEFAYKLLKTNELMKYELCFDTSDLTKGDSQQRSQYYEKMKSNGLMSVNEIRQQEGLNPVDGGDEVIPPEPTPQPQPTVKGGDNNNESGNQKQQTND